MAESISRRWVEYRDGYVWLSWRGAHWLDHIERERRAVLLFMDPGDMYRVAHVETRLVRTAPDDADEHIDRLSHRYRGEPYKSPRPQERVVIQLEPVPVRSTLDWRPPTSA